MDGGSGAPQGAHAAALRHLSGHKLLQCTPELLRNHLSNIILQLATLQHARGCQFIAACRRHLSSGSPKERCPSSRCPPSRCNAPPAAFLAPAREGAPVEIADQSQNRSDPFKDIRPMHRCSCAVESCSRHWRDCKKRVRRQPRRVVHWTSRGGTDPVLLTDQAKVPTPCAFESRVPALRWICAMPTSLILAT